MSLLVGILCEDGVVIGSDSSRAAPAEGHPAVGQPVRKTHVVGGDVIFAATGPLGLAQRFELILRELREDSRFPEWDHFSIARSITAEAVREFASTHSDLAGFGALVAFGCATGLHLCEFAVGTLQPEFKRPDLWFVAMGPGRATAESLLGLVRRTFHADRTPTLDEGTLAAAWAIQHAVELSPGRVQAPLQIAVLAAEPVDPTRPARLLSDKELAEQLARVRQAESHLGQFRGRRGGP
jgi:20S proteasome alpha/beta subunit